MDECVTRYNQPNFIENDPISIPHQFTKLQDIEIMGFWVAMLAWGQRKTIINKSNELVALMDHAPHDFILNHTEKDRKKFINFKHRTFQLTDTLYFLEFFQNYYKQHHSLENAFSQFLTKDSPNVGKALEGFHNLFFSLEDSPKRTRKTRCNTCKKINL